jgi:Flp pilus assembly secretin CpaC
MHARSVGSIVILLFVHATFIHVNMSSAQQAPAPGSSQVAGCPTVLPVAEGERSIVVPTVAPQIPAPHVATLPQPSQHEAAMMLLREKLAQRDQLQREIDALRASTQTPEQISVTVKVVEINRTKLRQLNVDWSTFGDGKDKSVDVAALLGIKPGPASAAPQPLNFHTNVDPAILAIFDSLERQQVSRVLAAPTVVTTSGHPASINIGGELSAPQPEASGGLKNQKYGTQVDLDAVSLGDNRVRIHVRPRVSELDPGHAASTNGQQLPAVSVRQFDTIVEMEFGKTTVMSGLVQEHKTAKSNWLGRDNEQVEEVALMLIMSPQIVR